MTKHASLVVISIFALFGLLVQGPLACAFHCTELGGHAHHIAHVELGLPPTSVADGPVSSMEEHASPCPVLEARGVHALSGSAQGPSVDETRLPEIALLDAPRMSARVLSFTPDIPSGHVTIPAERPPTA